MTKKIILMDFLRIEDFILPAFSKLLAADYKILSSRNVKHDSAEYSALICLLNDDKDSFSEELGRALSFCLRHKIRNIIAIVNNLQGSDSLILKEMNVCSVASMGDSIDDLKKIIYTSLTGRLIYSEPFNRKEWVELFNHVSKLSIKEKDVIGSLMDGLSVTEIAYKRKLSTKTISAHKCNAMRKLGLKKKYDFLKLKRTWFY